MARLDLGYINGKRKRKCLYGKTRKEVAKQLRQYQVQRDQGINIAPERLTVSQFLERWLADVVSQRCRLTTREVYRHNIRRITKHLGGMQLAKLTSQQVQDMLKALVADGYAPATVDRARDVLINALETAVQWELIPRNVAKLTTPPKVEQYRPRVLLLEEMQRLVAAAAPHRYLNVLCRLGLLGLRKGEALGLRWQDIDFTAGTLHIAVNLQRVNGKLVLVRPKTHESQRTLPMPASLVTALHVHQARQRTDQLLAGSAWKEHGLVITTKIGTPLSPRRLLEDFTKLLQRAGLPHMRFHDLRHSCATLLLKAGEPIKVVQEILGHRDPRITLGVYQQVAAEDRARTIARMDALLAQHDVR
jgi:integrase